MREELTLRKGEEGGLRTFIDTTKVADSRVKPPIVDEDWDAIYKGVEREEWESTFYKYLEMHKAVNIRLSSTLPRPRLCGK